MYVDEQTYVPYSGPNHLYSLESSLSGYAYGGLKEYTEEGEL